MWSENLIDIGGGIKMKEMNELKSLHRITLHAHPTFSTPELGCYQVGHCLFVASVGKNLTKSVYNLLSRVEILY